MVDEVGEIKRGQFVFGMPVLKAGVGDNDLWASLRVVVPLDTAVDIQHGKRLCIGQSRCFDCFHLTLTSLEILLRGLLPFEEGTVEYDVTGAVELLRPNLACDFVDLGFVNAETRSNARQMYIAYQSSSGRTSWGRGARSDEVRGGHTPQA